MDYDNTIQQTIVDPDCLCGPQVIQAMIKKPGMLTITITCNVYYYVHACIMYYFY